MTHSLVSKRIINATEISTHNVTRVHGRQLIARWSWSEVLKEKKKAMSGAEEETVEELDVIFLLKSFLLKDKINMQRKVELQPLVHFSPALCGLFC